jgi:hypothetical protein
MPKLYPRAAIIIPGWITKRTEAVLRSFFLRPFMVVVVHVRKKYVAKVVPAPALYYNELRTFGLLPMIFVGRVKSAVYSFRAGPFSKGLRVP